MSLKKALLASFLSLALFSVPAMAMPAVHHAATSKKMTKKSKKETKTSKKNMKKETKGKATKKNKK